MIIMWEDGLFDFVRRSRTKTRVSVRITLPEGEAPEPNDTGVKKELERNSLPMLEEPRYNDTGYLLACDLKKELEKNSLTGYLSACEEELFHCSYCKYPTRDCKEIYYEDEEYYTCSQYEPSREK